LTPTPKSPTEASGSTALTRWRISGFHAAFVLVLLLGIFARVWEFGTLPPGLNQDEASTAVDAYSLYRFGVDRNGIPFPVHLIAWGSGMSALYAYVMIPFVALGGLTPVIVRMPVLISAVLTLPVLYWIGSMIRGRRAALISMFLLAISPWHILMSRWGHEANLLPFMFALGFAFILKSRTDNLWFLPSLVMFALCLYTYAPALATVPIFLLLAIAILMLSARVAPRVLAAGVAVFALMAAPIAAFVIVNILGLDGLRIGFLSIPHLPSRARFENQAALFGGTFAHDLKVNALTLGALLWKQTDHQPWNVVEPYGYFYRYTFPLAAFGAVVAVPYRRLRTSPESLLLLAWLAAAGVTGLLQPANINRVNLIFIPLLLVTAICLDWLGRHFRIALPLGLTVLFVAFLAFTRDFNGRQYRESVEGPFFAGLLDAIDYARHATDGPICVTDRVNMPYIFVLFSEKMDPASYLPTIVYDDPKAEFRAVRRLGRYTFGLRNCADHSDGTVYVLRDELLPGIVPEEHAIASFGDFSVFSP
jgi:4-amino-4-deoxy-L-arabinose transferase-like glycosyltransferase